MPIPTPPADNSGGYMIVTWSNGTDSHRQRLHLRPFDNTATFSPAPPGPSATVMAEFTALYTKMAPQYFTQWTAILTSIFKNNGDGTFTELFGWTPPAPIAGTAAGSTANDQSRAAMNILNFKDGFGGRARLNIIAQGPVVSTVPQVVSGAPAGSALQQLVDYLTNQSPVKSNVVSHGGHALASPVHETFCVNKRLRRHYGYA